MRKISVIFIGLLLSAASNAANTNNKTEATTFLNAFKMDDPNDGSYPKSTEPFRHKSIQNAATVLASIEDGPEFHRVFDLFKTIIEYNFSKVYGEQCSGLRFFRYCLEPYDLPMLGDRSDNSETPIVSFPSNFGHSV